MKVFIAGGSGHITETNMIKGLHEAGIDIHAAFYPDSYGINSLNDSGVPIRELPLRSNIDLKAASRIRQWIKKEKFDIVHGLGNRQVANFIWASYGLANKVIAYRGAVGHVSRWDPSCYLKWLNPRIDHIICVSKAVEYDLLRSGVPQRKLRTIYKGHSPDWYAEISRHSARSTLEQEYDIPNNAILIGMAANMRRIKGADILLRAMRSLPDNVHVLLIGEVRDPQINRLADETDLRDRVHLAGYRTDAAKLISAVDIVAAPSRDREGLTKGVIEAMIHSIPAVVSSAGGLPELIDNQISGFVVPKEDSSTLAARLKDLVEDPQRREAMGIAARQRIIEKFSVDRTITETLTLYQEVLSG